jgi:hypothetical protein
LLKASSNSCERKNCDNFFLNLGTICLPGNFYSKNVPEVSGKKDRRPLTSTMENFTPMRRLGGGKYNNQQRLGLGGKDNNGRRLVVAVDCTAAAAAVAAA